MKLMQQTFPCPRCNNVAYLGQRFCGYCDLNFLYSCDNCGSTVSPDYNFCGVCGTQIEWIAQPVYAVGEYIGSESAVQQEAVPAPAPAVPEPSPAYLHHDKSLAHLKDGHYELAIDELSKAIQYDPGKAIVYMLRGGAYYKK